MSAIPSARAIDIQFDFSFDSSNFFNGNLQRQNVLNAAALVFESRITDTLSAITPGRGNTWTATFENPSTGLTQSVVNRTIATNVIGSFSRPALQKATPGRKRQASASSLLTAGKK